MFASPVLTKYHQSRIVPRGIIKGSTLNARRGEEVFHRRGNFHDVCLDCEMTGIEELDLCVRQVFSKSFGSRRNEKRIILAPDRKQWRLRLAKIFLKFRIERYIRCVIEKQVELNTLVAWTI